MAKTPANWELSVPRSMLRRDEDFVVPRDWAAKGVKRQPAKGVTKRKPETKRKPAAKKPALRDYAASAANTALGVFPQSIAESGFKTGQAIGDFIRTTTPEDALAIGKAIPRALYEEATQNTGNFLYNMLPILPSITEGAQLRSKGRAREAYDVERGAVPEALLDFLPLGALGVGAKAATRAARGAPEVALPPVALATSERVPYVNARHLPGLFDDEAARVAYSADPRASWSDAAGDDILYKALGVDNVKTRPATGFYRPPGKPGTVETNPATVGVLPGDTDPRIMDAAEAARAYFDTQGAGAHHTPAPGRTGGSMTIPHSGPVSARKLADLSTMTGPIGLGDIVDTGNGVTVTNFYPGPPTGAETAAVLRSGRAKNIEELVGAYPQPSSVSSGYRSMFENVDPAKDRPDYVPGSGRITAQLEELLSEYPEAADLLDASPDFRRRIASGRALDEEMAAALGGVNPYVQTARKIAAESGLRGLFGARRQGVALPSIAALLSAYGLSGEDDGSGY